MSQATSADHRLAEGVADLIHSYRELGHCNARLDPLGHDRPPNPLLELSEFGLSDDDLDVPVTAASYLGPPPGTLRKLIQQLQTTYCGTVGVEYMEIADKAQRQWLQERMEPMLNQPELSADQSRRILKLLVAADTFEKFLHARFLGQKRFSIEGAEALVPLLDTLIEDGADLGVEEVVLGMAHRGRLNVLAQVVHKPLEIILSEFLSKEAPHAHKEDEGDVKYHLGYSSNRTTATGQQVHISLSNNPSHLELIDPVIEGLVRAKQERRGEEGRRLVVPILIHGEAAFTGQGVVPETLNLSELPGYRTGGTIHIIVNNQLGFTATARETRFTPYPTDVAKMIQAPIFHVNADNPEAVVHAARLAIAFRQRFQVDVMIDLVCYRRHGHNEADEPAFTQPVMYREIDKHPPVAELYAEQLARRDRIDPDVPEQMSRQSRERLEEALRVAREFKPKQRVFTLGGLWEGLSRAGDDWSAETAVAADVLATITQRMTQMPQGFQLHRKLRRSQEARAAMARGEKPIDWSCAEAWAIGSLLLEGTPVRLTGEDTERGTFSHRHAVLHDERTGEPYVPLQHLAEDQAAFTVINTMLSELGVLGFEYGYSSADPWTLVIWEAQFGDFSNGAQPIIDQFIASAEAKWQRMSGIVLLLPHAYEGQGPEHSSARLERFLQLCAEDNLQVCYPTRSAQYFHLLRRQMRRNFRKPLIVMSPKSLLRDERAASALAEFSDGTFKPVIDDRAHPDREQARRLLLCSGRIYFTLEAARREHSLNDVALARVEQLYPLPRTELKTLIAHYPNLEEIAWVQEEPRNMGAWTFIEPQLRDLLPEGCELVGHSRPAAASPATGSFRTHQAEELALVERALGRADAAKQPERGRESIAALAEQNG
ncbi:MAG TPA: 2-oxoglutarate dehydrogenase E1 component [Pirellulaceae bacterium]|nr:2-oxoglutarate dehydrogenase E1 component [Pirellulaceae bacterium]